MASFQDIKDNALSYLVVGMIAMMWYDIRLMNTKINVLIETTIESKAKINALEREVFKAGMLQQTKSPFKLPKQIIMAELVALRPDQDNKVRKYLTTI
jgi:hypothetical protein